jgi:D-aspartate ligase
LTTSRIRPSHLGQIDTSTPVVVLSAKTHGSLGILRSLGRLGIEVVAVDGGPRGAASYSRYLRKRSRFDLDDSSPQSIVEHLLNLGEQIGRRSLLIPTWDETSLLVSEYQDALSESFLFARQPQGLAAQLSDKRAMAAVARQHGVPTPELDFPTSVDDVRRFAATAHFPVMLKGIDGNRLYRRTGRKMAIVRDRAELVRLYGEMEDPASPNLMLQEYIPGGDDTVWMYNGYFNAESEPLIGFTGRKLRQSPVYTGATSLGICLPNDPVAQTTERWMKALGYRGILDIGYRYDARDGRYKVLDVNPRIGATFRLFVARNGMDVVRALYLDLTDQPVPIAEPRIGRKWMVEKDFASSYRYWRDGRLSIRDWLVSLRGIQELGYFATDDMRPFARLVAGLIRRRTDHSISARM